MIAPNTTKTRENVQRSLLLPRKSGEHRKKISPAMEHGKQVQHVITLINHTKAIYYITNNKTKYFYHF